jgi:hypothetical protein
MKRLLTPLAFLAVAGNTSAAERPCAVDMDYHVDGRVDSTTYWVYDELDREVAMAVVDGLDGHLMWTTTWTWSADGRSSIEAKDLRGSEGKSPPDGVAEERYRRTHDAEGRVLRIDTLSGQAEPLHTTLFEFDEQGLQILQRNQGQSDPAPVIKRTVWGSRSDGEPGLEGVQTLVRGEQARRHWSQIRIVDDEGKPVSTSLTPEVDGIVPMEERWTYADDGRLLTFRRDLQGSLSVLESARYDCPDMPPAQTPQ